MPRRYRSLSGRLAKAAVAGAFFGVIVEVAVYAGVQVSGKKERNFEG